MPGDRERDPRLPPPPQRRGKTRICSGTGGEKGKLFFLPVASLEGTVEGGEGKEEGTIGLVNCISKMHTQRNYV